MKTYRTFLAVLLILFVLTSSGGTRNTGSAIQEFQTQEGHGWTFSRVADGKVRAIYGKGTGRLIKDETEARLFFKDYSEMFGIEDISHLVLKNAEKDESGMSYFFSQSYYGVPVVGGGFSVHTDKDGRILAASGKYHSLRGLAGGNVDTNREARATVTSFLFADAMVSEGTLQILPSFSGARAVWKFDTMSARIPGQWAVYVDALAPNKILRVQKRFAEAEAQGTVFPENPVVTPQTSSERFLYLKESNRLDGKFLRTYNANSQLPFPGHGNLDGYTTAGETDKDYTFPVSDSRFSEAMAYYHINVVHDRWRSFGFKKLNRQLPVFVNIATTRGEGYDNAFYSRGGFPPFQNGVIVMGAGNRLENLGHDADVYYHEYGHAVLDRTKPEFFETIESNYPWAFHEGFSDISAAAITGNSKLGEFALRSKTTGVFLGRNLENKNRYPENVILKGFGRSESHYTGLIIGGAWWDLQKTIGIPNAQEILFKSLAILPDDMNFFDLRDSMLTADSRSHGGANEEAIRDAFAKHGLGGNDPGQPGTVELRSLKSARLNFSNFRLSIRSSFNRGDYIVILAGYLGKGLTPGYNLISEMEIDGPQNANVSAFPSIDEVSNGLRVGKKGAWAAEIQTLQNSAPGEYTVTIRGRLGGTTNLTQTKSVKFKLN
jgi:Zn-dependent metalloprotease